MAALLELQRQDVSGALLERGAASRPRIFRVPSLALNLQVLFRRGSTTANAAQTRQAGADVAHLHWPLTYISVREVGFALHRAANQKLPRTHFVFLARNDWETGNVESRRPKAGSPPEV